MKNSILMIGNFLSATSGSRGVCEELAKCLAIDGWQVFCTSTRQSRLLRVVDMLVTAVRRRRQYSVAQVDVFSGPAFIWAEAVGWTLHRLGKPYVLTLHGGNLPQFAGRSPDRVRKFLQSANAVTAPSAYLQQQMEAFCPTIRVIPNAIDITAYPHRSRVEVKPNLVWLRAFHETYNPLMAAKVLGRLAARHPEVLLTMIGPDKGDGSLQKIQAAVAAMGLQEHVSYPGKLPKRQIPEVLAKGDIFLNTTRFDNTPVSVIEAMACGLCVVSTNVGGLPYLLKNEYDALLVPSGDESSMSEAVERLLSNPGLANSLSLNSRRHAEQFSWAVVRKQWRELLSSVVG